MEFWLPALLFLLGLLLIVKGGDFFVDAASWIAEASGIPKLIVGATLVSFATTIPELLVSVMATAQGDIDIAAGNAIGSVTANLGLILGVSILCMPLRVRRTTFFVPALLMLAGCALLLVFCRGGVLTAGMGLSLFLVFAAYMTDNVGRARNELTRQSGDRAVQPARGEAVRNAGKFLIGIVGIVVGAQLMVDNGKALALLLGVPERIIGITLVAVGTSLPELVTTITALVKREASLSVGNIIGANTIDLTLILPVCALTSGGTLRVSPACVQTDLPVCLLMGCIALLPPLITGRFHRWQGGTMLAGYALYVGLSCFGWL